MTQEVTKTRKRSGKKSKKISFDEEIVPKDTSHAKPEVELQNNVESESINTINGKHLGVGDKGQSDKTSLSNKVNRRQKVSKIKTTNKDPKEVAEINPETVENDAGTVNADQNSKEESIRAKKRKKHQQLIEEKKMKVDVALQQKCLNYLSQWKHNREEWKFEKLRQIWLQQNMFDKDKIPDEFWDTLVDYFSSSKGRIRQTIIDDAVKIIERDRSETCEIEVNEENMDDEEKDSISDIQFTRAKNIVQCLNE